MCGKESNSIYLANKLKENIEKDDVLFLTISNTLRRDFKGIVNNNLIKSKLGGEGLIIDFINILYNNAELFISGSNIKDFYKNIEQLNIIKIKLIEISNIELLFIVSKLYEVVIEMINNSVWNILKPLGFSHNYILSLTKNTDKNIYEFWEGQRKIIKNLFINDDNRVLINIPTSGGKTQIAELSIIKELEKNDEYYYKRVIYIVPTNALSNQIEGGFFNRFRGLGYKVSSNIDIGNDLDDINDDLIILTPEKLDLIIRKEPDFINTIGLFIFDEFHKINDGDRGLLLETLFSFLMLRQNLEEDTFKIITLSAIVDNLDNINKWFGNDNGLFQSNWIPTRKLYGILKKGYHVSKTSYETPFHLVYKYNNVKGNINDLFKIKTKLTQSGKKAGEVIPPDNADKIYELILKLYSSDKSPILVFFGNKKSLLSIIKKDKLNKYGDLLKEKFDLKKSNQKLLNLKSTLEYRLSVSHPLIESIGFGIGFHNGDLPKDVRFEIENAYNDGIIKILLTTSTLSEGVNLPIKNLIFHNIYGISIGYFRNIIGRVGRAMKESEGNIFFINSDGGKIVHNKNEKLVIKSFLSNVEFIEGRNKIYSDFLDYVSRLDEEERDIIVKKFDRLQIFIYSVYEYMKNNNTDISLDEVKKVISNGLYFIDKNDIDRNNFNSYYNYAYNRVEEIYNESPYTLNYINKTGLSDNSFWELYEICKLINFEPNQDISILGVLILNPYPDYKELITEDIFNKLLEIKEFKKTIVKNSFEDLDNYNILISWIKGDSFIEIRDKFFIYENDIVKRTSIAVKYITSIFEYILPWTFSSLAVVGEGIKLSVNILKEIRLLPLKVKHGVGTEYGIDLVKLGIEYHELLHQLESLYIKDKKEHDENSIEIFYDIGDWLLNKSFHSLEKSISSLKNNISFIKNIGKVKNKLKPKTNELKENGRLLFKVQGIFSYEFKNYNITNIDNIEYFRFNRQYNNPYDYFAIKIYYGDGFLGYVESNYSEELSDYLQNGEEFEVIDLNNDGNNIFLTIHF
ncbi:DEAD/DEAH box helicase [Candidatus Gracilibacteria bacterium]|nr:DEAD/DEAH box helicase [Candidatus Gracilibacteria bacterium]